MIQTSPAPRAASGQQPPQKTGLPPGVPVAPTPIPVGDQVTLSSLGITPPSQNLQPGQAPVSPFAGLPPGVPGSVPSPPQAPDPAAPAEKPEKTGGGWKKVAAWSAIGLAGLGVVAGLGGFEETSQVAEVDNSAPVTLFEEDQAADQKEENFEWKVTSFKVGQPPTMRNFGEYADSVSITTDNQVYTKAYGYFTLGMETQVDHLHINGHSHNWDAEVNRAVSAFSYKAESNWNAGVQIRPAGQAGPYVSARIGVGGYTPMAWGSTFNQTFDTRTGEKVTLSQVVGEENFGQLLDQVRQGLNESWGYQHDEAALQSHVDNSFALFQQDGETYVSVAVPGSTPETALSVAEMVFKAPAQ